MQVSAAQTKSNIETALANARLNAVNQVTPYGTVTYSYGAAPGGGAGGAGAGGAGAGMGADPRLASANAMRAKAGLPPLVPGTPQYQQWLMSQNRVLPYGAGNAGNAGGVGMGPAGTATGGGAGGIPRGDPSAGSYGGQPTM